MCIVEMALTLIQEIGWSLALLQIKCTEKITDLGNLNLRVVVRSVGLELISGTALSALKNGALFKSGQNRLENNR